MNYYKAVLNKYAEFNGRAQRAEYWYFVLFNFLIGVGLSLVGSIIFSRNFGQALNTLYSLAVLVPSLAVGVRRLHDIGKSGWWLFLVLLPIVGPIWLLVLMATDSNPGDNQYGPNPKGVAVKSV